VRVLLNGEWRPFFLYDRETFVDVLVYHQPTSTSGCICGWAKLGASHAEHVADQYERIMGARVRP